MINFLEFFGSLFSNGSFIHIDAHTKFALNRLFSSIYKILTLRLIYFNSFSIEIKLKRISTADLISHVSICSNSDTRKNLIIAFSTCCLPESPKDSNQMISICSSSPKNNQRSNTRFNLAQIPKIFFLFCWL